MKRLKSVENDQVQLEVVECDCGYHFGIDATYIDQISDFVLHCPACDKVESTASVLPEEPLRLCPYHQDGLGWDACTEGFEGCQIEEARKGEKETTTLYEDRTRPCKWFNQEHEECEYDDRHCRCRGFDTCVMYESPLQEGDV